MDNIGQYFKDGIKKVSEAAMDAVVTSIVANQDQHLHHLQDIQQWGIIKLIQRWTTSKYLHQRPSVIPFQGFSLISLLYKKKLKNLASEESGKHEDASANRSLYDRMLYNLLQKQLALQEPLLSRSIGKIYLNVKDCFFVLLRNPLNSRLNIMKTFQWRIIATYGEEKKETISARMVQKSQQEIISSLMLSFHSESLNFALDEQVYNTICWNHVIEFHNVNDLFSDICLTLMWRQTVDNDKASSSENSFTSEDIIFSDAYDTSSKFNKVQSMSSVTHSSEKPENTSNTIFEKLRTKTISKGKNENSMNNSLLLLEDSNPSRKRKAGTEWTLYGRAIIPLSSLLCENNSFSFDSKIVETNQHHECMKQRRSKEDEKIVRHFNEEYMKGELKDTQLVSLYKNEPCEWCCSSNLLLNLYPHNKKELKYYRPMPGYTALGMQNPQLTLGFLRLSIQFKSDMSRRKAILLSMLNSPNSRWINSYSFEPQYLEAYGQRAKHCITSYPRWVSKFLHLFSIGEKPKRNIFDKFFVAFFWIQILGGVLCLPIYYLPLCFLGILLCISFSYRFGNHSTVPCSFSLMYKDNCLHKCDSFQNCYSTIKSMRNCCYGNDYDGQETYKGHYGDSKKLDMLKTYETKKEMLDGIVLCKSNNEPSNSEEVLKKNFNESKNGLCDTSQKAQGSLKNVNSKMVVKRLTEGYNKFSNFEEHFHSHNTGMSENSTLNYSCIRHNGERIDLDLEDRTFSIKRTDSFKLQQTDSQPGNNSTEDSSVQVDKKNCSVMPKNVSVMDSPIGTLVSSVCDSTSYCSQYPIFSDDVENQNVHRLLDEGLDLLDAVQRVAGISSSIIEKLKFAFNWEDPLITEVSLVVAALVTLQITLLVFIFMKLPRWIARLPILSPLFFFIVLTDPVIQQKLWLETFGIDIVMIYSAFLSRTAFQVQKKKTSYILLENQSNMKQSEGYKNDGGIEDKSTKGSSNVLTISKEEPNVDCKVNDTNTDGTGMKTWMGLRNRWRNVMNAGQKVNQKLPTKQKTISQQNLADFECSQEKVYQKSHESETRQRRETDICPVDNVSVLSVSANVITLLQENQSCRNNTLKRFFCLKSIWLFLQLILLRGPFLLLKKVFLLATIPLRFIFFFLFLLVLHTMDLIFRFLFFWWIRLPDRREIEHRQIAASQRISFFKNTMPPISLKPSCTFKSIETKTSLPTDTDEINVGRIASNDSGYDQPGFPNVNESKNSTLKEKNLCSPKTVSNLIKTNLIKMVASNSNTSKFLLDKSIHEEFTVKVDDVLSDATNPSQSQDNSNINKESVSHNLNSEMIKDYTNEFIENFNETTHNSISQFLKKESPNLLSYREDASFSNTITIIKKALPFCTGTQTTLKNVSPINAPEPASNDLDPKLFKSDNQNIPSSSSNHSLKLCSFSSVQETLFEDKTNDYLTDSDGSSSKKSILTKSLCETPQDEVQQLLHIEETCTTFKPADGVISKILSNYNKNPTLALLKNYF